MTLHHRGIGGKLLTENRLIGAAVSGCAEGAPLIVSTGGCSERGGKRFFQTKENMRVCNVGIQTKGEGELYKEEVHGFPSSYGGALGPT